MTVDGHVLASGTSTSEQGFSGTTAPLPDLGRSRSVTLELWAIHDGPVEPGHGNGPWTWPDSVDFVAPESAAAPAAQPANARPAPQEEQAPVAAAAKPAAGAQVTRPASRGTTVARPKANAKTATGRAARTTARSVRAQRAVRPAAVAAAPDAAPATVRTAGRTTRSSGTRQTARRATAVRARPLPPPRASTWVAPPLATADDGRHVAGGALIALFIGVLAHGAGVLARLCRRVPAAQLPETEEFDALGIERELQEIIAAERAKTIA